MTLRNMQIFLAVADSGSMSEAAKRLSIAQPSVSSTIAEIEEQYGIRLFERLGRKLYITQAGEQLEKYARHILAEFDDMERELRNAQENVTLRIGATLTVGTCIMTEILERFRESSPNTETRVMVYNTRQIEQMLLKSELDVAVVEGEIKSRELCTSVVMKDPLVLVASAERNPFSGRDEVTREELAGVPFVMREVGSGTRALFESAMGSIPIHELWRCSSSEAILAAVEKGFGCAVISRRLARERIDRGTLAEVRIVDAELERDFKLVWHKNKHRSGELSRFMELCGMTEA